MATYGPFAEDFKNSQGAAAAGAPHRPPADSGVAGNPTHPDNDPVLAALNQVLMSAAGPPDHAAYLAPFDGAEAGVKNAYAAALPKIAAAYQQVRKDLGMLHEQSQAEHQRTGAARGQAISQGRAEVADNSVLRSALAMVGGAPGEASLSSLTAGAQAQQQAQLNSYDAAAMNESNFASSLNDVEGSMHTDRMGTSDLINNAANDQAENNQAKGLSAVAAGRADAELKYQQMIQEQEAQRAEIRLKIAEYESDKPLNDLRRAKAIKELEGEDDDEGGLPRAADFGELAQKSPVAFGLFSELVVNAGSKADRTRAEKEFNELLADKKGEGAYDEKTDSVIHEGKRISVKVLRSWLDHQYRKK